MKGMIFTEFLDLVESRLGLAVKDRILQASGGASEGVYTAVGNYPAAEMLSLVDALAHETGQPAPRLMEDFGVHMFDHFTHNYGRFFASAQSCFDFLGNVEDYIHVEVRKLYPQAELPSFSYPHRDESRLVMEYRSPRPMAAFATGLVRAAVSYYGEPIALEVEDLANGQGTAARFTLTRTG